MNGIYLSHFFRQGNPFHLLGWLWFIVFGSIAVYYYVSSATETSRMQRVLGRVARVLPAGLAGLSGWIAFGYLWVIDWREFRWEYLVVAAVAFLGITGFLPKAIWASKFFHLDAQTGSQAAKPALHAVQVQGALDLRVHS